MHRLAIEKIKNEYGTLYQQLINWNYEAGSIIEDEIVQTWTQASEALNRYNIGMVDVIGTLRMLQQEQAHLNSLINSSSSSSSSYSNGMPSSQPNYNDNSLSQGNITVGNTGNYNTTSSAAENERAKQETAKAIVSQMKANSYQWHEASDSGKTWLSDENKRLAAQLQSVIGRAVVPDVQNGVWYLDRVGGEQVYAATKFKDGGVVDYTGLAEVHGGKGYGAEMMLNNADVGKVYDLIHTSDNLTADLKRTAKEISEATAKWERVSFEDLFNVSSSNLADFIKEIQTPTMLNNVLGERMKDTYKDMGNIVNNQSETSSVVIEKVEIPVFVTEKIDKKDIQRLRKEFSDIMFGSANSVMRGQGKFNRGSFVPRINN